MFRCGSIPGGKLTRLLDRAPNIYVEAKAGTAPLVDDETRRTIAAELSEQADFSAWENGLEE
jgi:hypothetical protein